MKPKEKEIGLEIKILSNLINRAISEKITESGIDDITGLHALIIGFIYHRSQLSEVVYQRDIEMEFNIRRSTVTGVLQLMEKNGLIKREPVEHDARMKKINLTPKAVKMHEIISKTIVKIENRLREGLTEDETKAFFDTIKKIKKNIE